MSSTKSPELPSMCNHASLRYTASSHANEAGYQRRTQQQRATAAGRKRVADLESDTLFPGPLVLPGDEFSCDPRYPPQSLRSWANLKERNEVSRRRNVLYVASPPDIKPDVKYMRDWARPQDQRTSTDFEHSSPQTQDVVDYLAAFYHGMQVKALPKSALCFSKWDNQKGRNRTTEPKLIGLVSAKESIGIRTRPSLDGFFKGQLNLDDLLDMAISILPEDAYALLMLVQHDLFEDEDDDFCCGRAYGGSRVALVSMARYNPSLDASQNVEREHAWPASHCEAYVQQCCNDATKPMADMSGEITKKAKLRGDKSSSGAAIDTPLQAAVTAQKFLTSPDPSGLWLSRVCQTSSHELGHCFGIDHCVYYACAMQASSSLVEDVRQPPYLCPVDLNKVLRATGADKLGRYEALHSFCANHAQVPMFAAFGAWLGCRSRRMTISEATRGLE